MIGNDIMNITTKQFPILTDVNLFWGFLADIYDREHGSGVAAPFFEYALQSSWMDQSYSFLDRLWLDGEKETKPRGKKRLRTGTLPGELTLQSVSGQKIIRSLTKKREAC